MSDKTFVDTNILVYAHDLDAKISRDQAQGDQSEKHRNQFD